MLIIIFGKEIFKITLKHHHAESSKLKYLARFVIRYHLFLNTVLKPVIFDQLEFIPGNLRYFY